MWIAGMTTILQSMTAVDRVGPGYGLRNQNGSRSQRSAPTSASGSMDVRILGAYAVAAATTAVAIFLSGAVNWRELFRRSIFLHEET